MHTLYESWLKVHQIPTMSGSYLQPHVWGVSTIWVSEESSTLMISCCDLSVLHVHVSCPILVHIHDNIRPIDIIPVHTCDCHVQNHFSNLCDLPFQVYLVTFRLLGSPSMYGILLLVGHQWCTLIVASVMTKVYYTHKTSHKTALSTWLVKECSASQ